MKEKTSSAAAFLLLIVIVASPLAGQESAIEDAVFEAALRQIPQLLHALHPAPGDGVAVARQTIGGAPLGFRSFTEDFFGSVIAEELLASYSRSELPKIERQTAGGFPVLPLDEIQLGAEEYDWERLRQAYPDLRWIVRVSPPAVDRLGSYGVVRYELLGRHGRHYASFVKFERQDDGSWSAALQRLGALWD
jgi:hypothetical protein